MHLAATDLELIDGFRWGLRRRIRPDATTLESAARVMTEMVYEALGDALLLARTFAMLRLSELPREEREFAIATAAKRGEVLTDDAHVLTLMASRGVEPAWNDRRASRDHLAIPLASEAYLASAPMIAMLMRDVRTFYVFDASTSTDDRGRYTISARRFVSDHDVRTVLGAGTRCGDDDTLVAMILFARQHVTRRVAEELEPVVDELVALTARAVAEKKLFER